MLHQEKPPHHPEELPLPGSDYVYVRLLVV
jgi:hypothetical protein